MLIAQECRMNPGSELLSITDEETASCSNLCLIVIIIIIITVIIRADRGLRRDRVV